MSNHPKINLALNLTGFMLGRSLRITRDILAGAVSRIDTIRALPQEEQQHAPFREVSVEEAIANDGPCPCGSTDHKGSPVIFLTSLGEMRGQHLDRPYAVFLQFSYDAANPVAISMEVALYVATTEGMRQDVATWVFGRDQLQTALTTGGRIGEADFVIEYDGDLDPEDGMVFFDLHGLAGKSARIATIAQPLRELLAASYSMVPTEAEDAAVAAEIDHLLGGQ